MPTAQCAHRCRVMCAARLTLCCEYLSNTQQHSRQPILVDTALLRATHNPLAGSLKQLLGLAYWGACDALFTEELRPR